MGGGEQPGQRDSAESGAGEKTTTSQPVDQVWQLRGSIDEVTLAPKAAMGDKGNEDGTL